MTENKVAREGSRRRGAAIVGGTRRRTISEMRRLGGGSSGSVSLRRRWSAEPAAPETWVTRSRSRSVRVRQPGSGRGRRDLAVAIVSEPRTGLGVGVAFDRHFFWRFFDSCASLIRISWLCSMRPFATNVLLVTSSSWIPGLRR